MSATLPSFAGCPDEACTPEVVQIPGTPGNDGTNGTNGSNGNPAWTLTAAAFTMPAEGATAASLLVGHSDFIAVGEYVFLQGAGTLLVTAIVDGTHVTLQNPKNTASGRYTSNVNPGTVVGSGALLVPTGLQGPTG